MSIWTLLQYMMAEMREAEIEPGPGIYSAFMEGYALVKQPRKACKMMQDFADNGGKVFMLALYAAVARTWACSNILLLLNASYLPFSVCIRWQVHSIIMANPAYAQQLLCTVFYCMSLTASQPVLMTACISIIAGSVTKAGLK